MGGMQVVLDQLESSDCKTLLDLGCGDGRFLREVGVFNKYNAVGVDYSKRAIDLARAMNPNLDYRVHNILEADLPSKFDVVTSVEVLEHIPLDLFDDFVDKMLGCLVPGGHCIITVPHTNKVLSEKHFQHFNSEKLRKVFSDRGNIVRMQPFDSNARWFEYLIRLLGGDGSRYLITHRGLWAWIYRKYQDSLLYVDNEDSCLRIMCVVEKK